MEIFSEVFDANRKIYQAVEPLDLYRQYRYCNKVGDETEYAVTDHFPHGLKALRSYMEEKVSSQSFAHLPQHTLTKILASCYDKSEEGLINFGTRLQSFSMTPENRVLCHFQAETGGESSEEFDLLVGCDGFNSSIRRLLGIEMKSSYAGMKFLNIYFKSKDLSWQLTSRRKTAMLHFVYNSKVR